MSEVSNLPSYGRPPVIEVVYGVEFDTLTELRAPHTGLFWSQIRESFPSVQHARPVGPLPREFDFGNLPLPRIWFVSEDENTVVQIQSNRFLFNWRVVRDGDVYPRFDAVQSGFQKYFAVFQQFVRNSGLGDLELKRYELTYINHIERQGKLKNLRNASSLFPDLRWRTSTKRYLPIPSRLTWSVAFEMDSKGRLAADLKPAIRNTDGQEIFVLEMKATGSARADGNEDADHWFAQAREWIVRGFADLTSERAQRDLWNLEQSND